VRRGRRVDVAERGARRDGDQLLLGVHGHVAELAQVEDDPTLDNRRTDLEGVEVAIELNFLEGGKVEMSREGGESYRGVWRVIERIPPKGAEIEISRLADDDSNAQGEEPKIAEKRRFTLEFQNDGQTPGFLLKEKGADPQFGQLYFRKQ